MTEAEPSALLLEGVAAIREDSLTGERRTAVQDVSLRVQHGERVALVGANGAGKTSLLLALVGATESQGRIVVNGTELSKRTLERVRQQLGFVFANPADQLFCDTVHEEVAFGPRCQGLAEGEVQSRTNDAIAQLELAALRDKYPGALSLGEQRRVAIAAVLSCAPKLILLDEPSASLDGRARKRLLGTLDSLSATCIVATHDLDLVLELKMRVVALHEGHVVADGTAEQVLLDRAILERAALEPPLSAGVRCP
ncbi:MAG TPA: ABC transporter ATP-binding protein [Polyangiaceae bacterium]|nr:ABC transporter ATP-binding protein [Polyangiaceae bacterium]